ncbi:MAG: DMT family transporter [Ignavibacteriales bacterium]|nr:DMT family transporter [Ignavibacteriales bacterium]
MTLTDRPSSRGMLFVVLAVSLWGGSASLAKFLFQTRYDPLIITQTRSSLSFLLLAAYFLITDRSVFRIRLGELYRFALIGIVGIAATNFTYYFTVKESSVATAILVQNIAPVVVMIYAVAISKEEELTGIKVISLVLALCGCFFAVSGGSMSEVRLTGWSLLTAPLSMLTYAFMLIFSKRVLRHYGVWTLLVGGLGFATMFWLLVNPPWVIAARGYGMSDWGVFLGFAVASILLPYIFFAKGLKILEATTVGILTTLEPAIAITVAWLALGESINAVQVAGTVGVVGSVLLLQVRRDSFRKFLKDRRHAE